MGSPLGQSFKFKCGLIAKNRVVLAPLTNMQSPSGQLSSEEFQWLDARIRGGFGIVTTCATHVMKSAQAWDGELGIFSDEHAEGFRRLAQAAQPHGALIIPQIFHGGFRCPSKLTGVQPVSASVFQIPAPDFEEPRALDASEILDIQKHFVEAAKRAAHAGLPGVEVHGANGYLFTQFLSPHTNTRTDGWGGSLANRARFLFDVVAAVRRELGPNKIVGVRISPENTKLIHSIDIEEMIEVATELHELGVDYISLSLWDAFKVPDKYPYEKTTIVERFRKAVPSATGITTSGKIWTLSEAERALESGADFVALGGAGIANPAWPKLINDNSQEPQRFPLTRSEFYQRAVSDRFVDYLERWNFVRK